MPSAASMSLLRFRRPTRTQGAADAIPILVDEEYHLFHLTTPPGTVHHPERLRSYWSHLRSRDLIAWERDRLPAIVPGEKPSDHDADGAWTGSAVLGPDGTMHIFYTGYNLSLDGKQVIVHAVASDLEASSFVKSPTAISITPKTVGNLACFEDIDFRDPYVLFNDKEREYWMLVATRLSTGPYWTRGCLALLTSTDLMQWNLEAEPFFAPNDMFCPECPELFTLPNGKWYLVYSRFSSPDAGTVYRVGDSPRGPFRKPTDGSSGRWDGRRWYAAKSCPKAGDPSKRIYFGWIADRCSSDNKWMWGGDMAFPRQVFADSDGSLRMEPLSEGLEDIFGSNPPHNVASLHLVSEGRVKTQFLASDALAIESSAPEAYRLSFKVLSAKHTASFGVLLNTDLDLSGYWLRFSPSAIESAKLTFTVSLSHCPPALDDFWADQYKLYLPREADGPELVRHDNVAICEDDLVQVLVTGETVEIFVGGRVLSYRLQTRDPNTRLGMFVDDGETTFQDITLAVA
ncbi:conserved hypothetical protein [Aspergillus terreus NIH2624]|uniref:beta-fructofuranosidase n=1 Tax=Aspergillus terreus (strain NIH 2624 / FGSC A1156) TaxID=341663 RepID=Q0CG36_ASPTN|nr:uncharacterized protein ATEG_07356 [Aspergillus terreus NIH2624]EAU32740.1 conserved hypothetical protein [Aspergillus terreus NIH2624]